jgi:outer membrane receptor for ferrienterochelin and colicin
MTFEQALDRLLKGSGLGHRVNTNGSVVIEAGAASVGNGAPQADGAVDSSADRSSSDITVVGSRIRGVGDRISPVPTYTRKDLELQGYTDLAQVITSLPQNTYISTFGYYPNNNSPGGASAGVVTPNLRGLGPGTTLTLINGHRIATADGFAQAVDISGIPSSAIDRMEILTDGASAVYGSDAIGGVVNIILRKNFNGAESRLGLAAVTDGGGFEVRAGQTVGFSRGKFSSILSYEYSSKDPIESRDKDWTHPKGNQLDYLVPGQKKHSLVGSITFTPTSVVELSLDGFFNKRQTNGAYAQYNLGSFVPKSQSNSLQFGVAPSALVRLGGNWDFNLTGSYSSVKTDTEEVDFTTTRPQPRTRTNNVLSKLYSVEFTVGGPLFAITGDSVKLLLGGHFHRVEVATTVLATLPKSRNTYAAFGELYAPLIEPADGVPLINSLALSGALRYERTDGVGDSLDPKIGVAWSPVRGLNIRGTFNTSFKVPSANYLAPQPYFTALILYRNPQNPSARTVALLTDQGNPNLRPERSRNWSVGVDYTPSWIKGLTLRGTYYVIDYTDKIGAPSITFNNDGSFSSFTGIPVQNPSSQQVAALTNNAYALYNYSDFFPITPRLQIGETSVILPVGNTNLARYKTRGLDASVNYRLDTGHGVLSFDLNTAFLFEGSTQVYPGAPNQKLLDTIYNPLSFKARGTIAWSTRAATMLLAGSYTPPYVDNLSSNPSYRVKPFWKFDASLQLNLGSITKTPIMQDMVLTLSVENVFNADPPRIGPLSSRDMSNYAYDSVNGDPVGRRVGLMLRKSW